MAIEMDRHSSTGTILRFAESFIAPENIYSQYIFNAPEKVLPYTSLERKVHSIKVQYCHASTAL